MKWQGKSILVPDGIGKSNCYQTCCRSYSMYIVLLMRALRRWSPQLSALDHACSGGSEFIAGVILDSGKRTESETKKNKLTLGRVHCIRRKSRDYDQMRVSNHKGELWNGFLPMLGETYGKPQLSSEFDRYCANRSTANRAPAQVAPFLLAALMLLAGPAHGVTAYRWSQTPPNYMGIRRYGAR